MLEENFNWNVLFSQYLSIDLKKSLPAHSYAHKPPKTVSPTVLMLEQNWNVIARPLQRP